MIFMGVGSGEGRLAPPPHFFANLLPTPLIFILEIEEYLKILDVCSTWDCQSTPLCLRLIDINIAQTPYDQIDQSNWSLAGLTLVTNT